MASLSDGFRPLLIGISDLPPSIHSDRVWCGMCY